MLWVVQNDLYKERGYQRFLDSLKKFNCEYIVVKPVPFSNILLPENFDSTKQNVEDVDHIQIPTNKPVVVFGTITLSKISKSLNLQPGTFLNDNFEYQKWVDGFGIENILSNDAIVGRVFEIQNVKNWDWLFVRPIHDTKALSGTVMSKYDFHDWKLQISQQEENDLTPLHKNTEIFISSAKKIYSEGRFFVVNGKVITGSMYKLNGVLQTTIPIDNDMLTFAKKMVTMWQPAKAFVIDIANTPDGYKVIEINNINSAGFYNSDTDKIVNAIENIDL